MDGAGRVARRQRVQLVNVVVVAGLQGDGAVVRATCRRCRAQRRDAGAGDVEIAGVVGIWHGDGAAVDDRGLHCRHRRAARVGTDALGRLESAVVVPHDVGVRPNPTPHPESAAAAVGLEREAVLAAGSQGEDGVARLVRVADRHGRALGSGGVLGAAVDEGRHRARVAWLDLRQWIEVRQHDVVDRAPVDVVAEASGEGGVAERPVGRLRVTAVVAGPEVVDSNLRGAIGRVRRTGDLAELHSRTH